MKKILLTAALATVSISSFAQFVNTAKGDPNALIAYVKKSAAELRAGITK